MNPGQDSHKAITIATLTNKQAKGARHLCLMLLILACVAAPAATITWTNTAGGSWNSPENWDPNQVPVAGDTAVITNEGTYTVTVDSGSAAVDDLTLGATSGLQTLFLPQDPFACSRSLAVGSNAIFSVMCESVVAGAIAVAGQMNWQNGSLEARVIIATNGMLNIAEETQKRLADGSAITNYGLIRWSGAGPIYGSDGDTPPEHPAIANMAGGVFEILSDANLGPIDNFNPRRRIELLNAGTIRKIGEAGMTIFDSVRLENTGVVDVQQGILYVWGTDEGLEKLTSAGEFLVAAGAAVQFDGSGACKFLPGHQARGEGFFGFSSGGHTLQGELAGRLDWAGGSLSGGLVIATNGVLNITGNWHALEDGAAITNYGVIRWSEGGSIYGNDWDMTPEHPTIVNMSGGVFELLSDANPGLFTDGNPNQQFVVQNAGTFRKVGGAGMTVFDSVYFENTGIVDVQQGILSFGSNNRGQMVSAGEFLVAAGAAVELNSGTCTFLPGHQAAGEGFFGLREGTPTLQGELGGRLDWESGSLRGGLVIASNGVLNIIGDVGKTLEDGSTITNYGIIRWSDKGFIKAYDWDTPTEHPAIVNMPGGMFDIQSDSQLALLMSGYNTNQYFVVQNAGTIRKCGGPGITYFDTVRLENTGLVDVQQGSIVFLNVDEKREALASSGGFLMAAGAAVELRSGSCTFLPGHQAMGEGFFGIRDGGWPILQGQLSGRLDWQGGILNGGLTITTNGALNIIGDGLKRLNSSALTNFGTINWGGCGKVTADAAEPDAPLTIRNMPQGVINITDDFVVDSTAAPGQFEIHNAGLLRKTGGDGTNLFENLRFANTSTMEVWRGTIGIEHEWINTGTLTLGVFSPAVHGSIHVFGVADVTGSLDVEFLNGFQPAAGDLFKLLNFQSTRVRIDFTTIHLPSPPEGLYFTTQIDSSRLAVETHQNSATTPVTLNGVMSNEVFRISFSTVAGSRYSLQSRPDFGESSWTPTGDTLTATITGTESFMTPRGATNRFYRVMVE